MSEKGEWVLTPTICLPVLEKESTLPDESTATTLSGCSTCRPA